MTYHKNVSIEKLYKRLLSSFYIFFYLFQHKAFKNIRSLLYLIFACPSELSYNAKIITALKYKFASPHPTAKNILSGIMTYRTLNERVQVVLSYLIRFHKRKTRKSIIFSILQNQTIICHRSKLNNRRS